MTMKGKGLNKKNPGNGDLVPPKNVIIECHSESLSVYMNLPKKWQDTVLFLSLNNGSTVAPLHCPGSSHFDSHDL